MRHDSGNHQRTDHSHGSVMKELRENGGIPGGIILLMAVMAGLTVASIYYNQPLLGMISRELDISHFTADMMTVVTQAGYAAGLMLVLPAGDLWSRRRIVIACMLASALMLLAISLSGSIYLICAASFVLGVSSVVPQLFIPLTAQFSEPRNRTRNIGFVLSGLLTGILAARVISGFLGEWLGWRAMFLIAAAVMVICTAVCLFLMPLTKTNFSGTYLSLLRSIIAIVREHPRIRLNSVRSAFGFGSMLTLWACMAFHVSGAPFFSGSDAVGWLGLCGMAGAIAASGMGRIIPRFGVKRLCVTGALIQADCRADSCRCRNTVPAAERPERGARGDPGSVEPRQYHLYGDLFRGRLPRHLLRGSGVGALRLDGRLPYGSALCLGEPPGLRL